MPTRDVMQSYYFEIWDEFILERDRLFSSAKYENNSEKLIWVLFARINGLSDEIIFLVRNSQFSSCQILMRNLLETYIDLRCSVDDETFIEVLLQAERKSEITYLKNFDSCNKYYGAQSKGDIERKLKELEELNDKSKNLNIYEKFSKAKALEAYRTVYNHLCRFSHGNITALVSRNFENERITLSSSISETELMFVLSSSINFAIASSIEVSTKLELGDKRVELFKDFLNRNNQIAIKIRKDQ
jgi:hypothetical protein